MLIHTSAQNYKNTFDNEELEQLDNPAAIDHNRVSTPSSPSKKLTSRECKHISIVNECAAEEPSRVSKRLTSRTSTSTKKPPLRKQKTIIESNLKN